MHKQSQMSITPTSIFGDRHNPLFPQAWDPFMDFHLNGSLQIPHVVFPDATMPLLSARTDWKETPEAHVLKADLPGLRKEDVKVAVEEGRVLRISGEKKMEKEERADNFYRMESSSGNFLRRLKLPENARADKMTSHMENGVLTVTIPKKAKEKHGFRATPIFGR